MAALLTWLFLACLGVASPPRRLPQAPECDPPGLLDPRLVLAAAPLAVQSDPRELLQLADGAVALRVPLGWSVVELPQTPERPVALLPPGAAPATAPEGMWLACHGRGIPPGYSQQAAQRELESLMPTRLRLATNNRPLRASSRLYQSQGFVSLRVDYEIAPVSGQADASPADMVGWHTLTRTPWGIVEAHAWTPRAHYAQRAVELESALASLHFSHPQLAAAPQSGR